MPENGFTSSLELIKHIRSKYNDYFCVGCAGYPEGHPNTMSVVGADYKMSETEKVRYSSSIEASSDGESEKAFLLCKDDSYAIEIDYLKQKIRAGAEFIITQMFFDVEVFKQFVRECRENGITVPIIPGIMLIGNYNGFKRMTKLCKTRVPEEVEKTVESLQDNDDALKQYGVDFGVKVCKQLLTFGVVGLHFYTLNSADQTLKILDQLQFTL
jgi:methylenetetrahydrofolate reductase (NADPH)